MAGKKYMMWPMISLIFVVVFSFSSLAVERFTDNGDGTVTDHQLKLMWVQSDNQGDINWKDAYRWVKFNVSYLLPGEKYYDWRMPNIKELRSLYVSEEETDGENSSCGMKIRVIPQIKLSCGWIWSSDNRGISANVFSFKKGYYFSGFKMHKRAHRVLAVRNIKE